MYEQTDKTSTKLLVKICIALKYSVTIAKFVKYKKRLDGRVVFYTKQRNIAELENGTMFIVGVGYHIPLSQFLDEFELRKEFSIDRSHKVDLERINALKDQKSAAKVRKTHSITKGYQTTIIPNAPKKPRTNKIPKNTTIAAMIVGKTPKAKQMTFDQCKSLAYQNTRPGT